MAFKNNKDLFLKVLKKFAYNHIFPVAVAKQCKTQLPNSILNYSSDSNKDEMSMHMKIYMKKYAELEKLVQDKREEFEKGKLHLANIMGEKTENMTQEKIDEMIKYLFPSALFVPKSRPMMKSPDILYKKQAAVAFDKQGRPFHHLFYTNTPNFYQVLHDAAAYLEKLNDPKTKSDESDIEAKPLVTEGSVWFTQVELEELLREKVNQIDYEKFLEIFDILASHPLSYMCSDFIMTYRKQLASKKTERKITPEVLPDGTINICIERSRRKKAIAKVIVTYPGTGLIKINGRGIDYFNCTQSREQVGYMFK